jgi:menaquinone-9 beta-reductase
MTQRYDVVVIGARCAGASFATFLARGGLKVLLVDRDTLPSDVVLSTHTVHPSGMQVVDELGLADDVRKVTPEMSNMRIDWFGGMLDVPFAPGHGEYCPKRKRFDQLLQEAAVQAGVDLRARTSATELVVEGGRVAGVHLKTSGGTTALVRTPLVVGADGRDSKVARWVGAKTYYDYEPPRGIYWSYWPAPSGWGISEQYPAGMYLYRCGKSINIAFHTDDDQLLLGVLPLRGDIEPFRAAPLRHLQAALQHHPMLGPIASGPPSEPARGYLGKRYFFRQPVGPGWLLLGDAGLYKDFLSGDGMSEALLQARGAARALLASSEQEGRERALAKWALQRDLDALPFYVHTRELANPDSSGALNRTVLQQVNKKHELKAAFVQTFSRATTPQAVVPAWRVASWTLATLLRGNMAAWSDFMQQGKRIAQLNRELDGIRQKLARL